MQSNFLLVRPNMPAHEGVRPGSRAIRPARSTRALQAAEKLNSESWGGVTPT
jgi:hypothetical protein